MNITIINTGGTFNKRYNPIKGELEVPSDNIALDEILESCYNINFEVKNVVSKDSLEINNDDREIISKAIIESKNKKIIIVHGTDTMDLTAQYLNEKNIDKQIVITGAMVPMSIKKVEATMNFSQAIGFLNAPINNGIYISMHGVVTSYENIQKDRKLGQFILQN
ncbi:asparaginase domain-containing protein [Arcobacter sp. YIC-310]|uniref:asparaginase domain-containing protein n=1 Tax=Arcobacter sp. YIC-310 TaxID=3376632 RepID=UPI003C25A2F5